MLALLLAATVGYYVPPAAPPAGRYVYVETVGSKRTNVTAIEVKYDGASIDVNESIKPEDQHAIGPFVDTKATLDASSLDLVAYHATIGEGCSQLAYDVDVQGAAAKVGDTWVRFPGVDHFFIDSRQALPIMLPAQMQAWRDAGAAIVTPVTSGGYAVVRDPATQTPSSVPSGVPGGDVYLSVRGAGHGAVAIWYDPKTLIADRIVSGASTWQRVYKP